MYTTVISYQNNPNYEAKIEKTVNSRTHEVSYSTVYVPKGTSNGSAIPQRTFTLDLTKLAEAQAQADKIREDLQS